MISCKQEGKLSIPVLHSRMGSEGPSSVAGRERGQKMVCAKPVINPAEPGDGRQHLKYPMFRTHVTSRTMLDCPRTSQQWGLPADNCYQVQNQGPHYTQEVGRSAIPAVGQLLSLWAVPTSTEITPMRTCGSPPGHSSPPQPQELGTGKPKGCFSPLMLMIEVFHFTPSSGSRECSESFALLQLKISEI